MKDQSFGDNRDLLKFDLVCEIIQSGFVDHFTFIPMLTESKTQKEEVHVCRHEASGGGANKALLEFLDNCIINEKRNVGRLEEFFQQCGIKATIYGKDKLFTHEQREAYFADIGNELMEKSLILVDPDKGLEEVISDSGNLLYSDLKNLYERMNDESILMFTQRFPYDMNESYLSMRIAEIKDMIPGSQPISLDDLDSIIFFLTKSKYLQRRLLQLLGEYAKKYAGKEKINS